MKELSIEEKAKAYDNVREKIAVRFGSNVANEIFSEYEESDDERIRKDLILYLKSILSNKKYGDKFIEDWIAWLEKQSDTQKKIDHAYAKGLSDAKKALEKQAEQKSAWSEEDERMYKGLHNLIYSTPYCDSRKEFSDWFKSLKERVQPQSHWKPSDEQMTYIQDAISKYNEFSNEYTGLVKLYNDLKKLRGE